MEQILKRLSEIEKTARLIMDDAEKTKLSLSEEAEEKCKAFDKELEAETAEKIRQIRDGLEQEKDAQLASLRSETDTTFSALDAYYEKNHERLAREIFQKIRDCD